MSEQPLAEMLSTARDFPHLRSLLETLSRQETPTALCLMSQVSLKFMEECHRKHSSLRQEHGEAHQHSRENSRLGAKLIKSVVNDCLSIRNKSPSGEKAIYPYLRRVAACYAALAAAPLAVIKYDYDKSFLSFFTSSIVGRRQAVPKTLSEYQYCQFQRTVTADVEGIMQGISGELLAYCLAENAGLEPEFSTGKEDESEKIDLWINSQGEKMPVQVKTSRFYSGDHFFGPPHTDRDGKLWLTVYPPSIYDEEGWQSFSSRLSRGEKNESAAFGRAIKSATELEIAA